MKSLGLAIFLSVTAIAVANAQASISDAKIHAFLTAAMSLNTIIEEWKPRIDNAESQEVADQLTAQANAEAIAEIEAIDGVTPDEYSQIAQAAQSDPVLSRRIKKIFQQSFSK